MIYLLRFERRDLRRSRRKTADIRTAVCTKLHRCSRRPLLSRMVSEPTLPELKNEIGKQYQYKDVIRDIPVFRNTNTNTIYTETNKNRSVCPIIISRFIMGYLFKMFRLPLSFHK